MADNVTLRDGNGSTFTRASKDIGAGVEAFSGVRVDGSGNIAPAGDAVGRSSYVIPGDGTRSVTVKAASTPAALTDTAQVVAQSPNCPLTKPTAGSPIRVSAKTLIKGSAGALFGLQIINTTASTRWVQLFDAATTGAVTLGSTLPDLEFQVAANSQVNVPLPALGVPFVNGIVYAATTAEGGATPGSAGDVLLFPQYA